MSFFFFLMFCCLFLLILLVLWAADDGGGCGGGDGVVVAVVDDAEVAPLRKTGGHTLGRSAIYIANYVGLENTHKYYYETDELPNSRPTQPKKIKGGKWATFSHNNKKKSRVGIGFI